jgi:hypothetical protein
MQVTMCFEVLLATVFLWVSIFGLFDVAVSMMECKKKHAAVYVVVGGSVLVFLATHESVSVCSLM